MARDSQRGKVYKAERHLPESMWGRQFTTVAECQAYYDRIVRSRWWRGRAIAVEVRVRDGRGSARATAWTSTFGSAVRLPRWSRHELWMLHELAHVLCARHKGWGWRRDIRPHGAAFVRAYLDLLRRWMGPETANAMRESMLEHGVRIVNRMRSEA